MPSSVKKGSAPPGTVKREPHQKVSAGYDELVLQWAMGATTLSASSRSDVLALATENRRATWPLLYSSTSHEAPEDELFDEMCQCFRTLRSDQDLEFRAAYALRRPNVDTLALLSKDVKLELCYQQTSESIFQLQAVWEELQQQTTSWSGLEIMEEASWQPTSKGGGTMSSYVGYGKDMIMYVRIHDVLTLDTSGKLLLIVRTLLFHPDDAARGPNARWAPHFGSLTKCFHPS